DATDFPQGCRELVLPRIGGEFPQNLAWRPAAVGVDIGCGMIGVCTQFHASDLPEDLVPLRDAIEAAIPLSPGNYNEWHLEGSADRRARERSGRVDAAFAWLRLVETTAPDMP